MFTYFKLAVQRQFNSMKQHDLFRMQVDKDKLWETYLSSFPEGANPMFRERTEHDCNCCKSFIRAVGNMVAIVDNEFVSIWDVNVGGHYQVVADALSTYVKSAIIENIFLHSEPVAGVDKNFQDSETGVITWEHFFIQLPPALVCRIDMGTKLGNARSTRDVMLRALREITLESIDTVLELISQGSLYRGEEHRHAVEAFRKLKVEFDRAQKQNMFAWSRLSSTPGAVSNIRSSVIGTLLVDLSEGKDLENAVGAFEFKVAPTNYKRPTALVTKDMIERARKTIEELGYTSALERRFAVLEDVSINNVLFADRSARKRMGDVFDELSSQVGDNPKNFDKVEEVSIETFLSDILPKIESIELMFENKHRNNLVSLIAPSDLTAKHMFKWPNGFSWSYTGEVADSIKERVKKAGGSVTGDVCNRLMWFNSDDLDFHMTEKVGAYYEIYYGTKRQKSPSGGMLDVDANAGGGYSEGFSKDNPPVENIVYENWKQMRPGVYELSVVQYSQQTTSDVGFEAEIDVLGSVLHFSYPKALKTGERVVVAELHVSAEGVKVVPKLDSTQSVKTMWNIPTQTFHKVNVVMLSPNYWDDKAVGNKHYFFMLDNCLNDDRARGFFNEFLSAELDTHRKVLEIVGSKMKTEESPNQLSGLGFSSTQRNSVLCQVKGNFTRTIKISF